MNNAIKVTAIICAMLFVLAFAGCISTGILSEKEAEEFFYEMKAKALDEKTWEREIEVEWPEGKDEETIGFVKAAMAVLTDGSVPERIEGTCRGNMTCGAHFDSVIKYEDKEYSISLLYFTEENNGDILIQVKYGSADTDYAEIRIKK